MSRSWPCRLLATTLVVLTTGCASDGYEVVLRFEPRALAADVVALEAAIVEDCAVERAGERDLEAPLQTIEVRRGGSPPALGELRAGRFGLLGRGFGGDCRVVAWGCTPISLEEGGEGRLVVTLGPIDGAGCPEGTFCRELDCLAGEPDADADVDADLDEDAEEDAEIEDAGDADREADAEAAHDADVPCDCTIEGSCRVGGERAPDDDCQVCDPSQSTTEWSALPDDTPCADAAGDGACRHTVLGHSICCSGCWAVDRVLCVAGSLDLACGHGGGQCQVCVSPSHCDPATGACEGS